MNKNSGVLIAIGAVFLAVVLTVTTVANASRNASGTMSGINGPYISGTTISSSVINNRYADIEAEITDSLSRSGKGGMTAALKGTDGTVAAPAYSFTSEPGTGLYRIGATDLGLAVNGVKEQEWTASATTIVQPLTLSATARGANGTVSAPEYSFTNDTGSGLYRVGSNDIGFAVNGVLSTEWNSTGFGIGAAAAGGFPLDVSAAGGADNARFGTMLAMMGSAPQIGFNIHNNSGNKYMTTNIGFLWSFDTTNGMIGYTAPSGTAGNAATVTERIRVNANGVTIGSGGTAISNSIRGSVSWNTGSVTSGGGTNTATVTVTGAAAGDDCILGFSATPNVLCSFGCYVSSSNTCNPWALNNQSTNQTCFNGTVSCRTFNP